MNLTNTLIALDVLMVCLNGFVLCVRFTPTKFQFARIALWKCCFIWLFTAIATASLIFLLARGNHFTVAHARIAEQGMGEPKNVDVSKLVAWPYRLDAHSLSQYTNKREKENWETSACGLCALGGVLNYYDQKLTIHDLVESGTRTNSVTQQNGLVCAGFSKIAEVYRFESKQLVSPTLDTIVQLANSGHPIIILFPETRYPAGHYVVITGGDANSLKLADSSHWNRKLVSREWFMNEWDGKSAWFVHPDRHHVQKLLPAI